MTTILWPNGDTLSFPTREQAIAHLANCGNGDGVLVESEE